MCAPHHGGHTCYSHPLQEIIIIQNIIFDNFFWHWIELGTSRDDDQISKKNILEEIVWALTQTHTVTSMSNRAIGTRKHEKSNFSWRHEIEPGLVKNTFWDMIIHSFCQNGP